MLHHDYAFNECNRQLSLYVVGFILDKCCVSTLSASNSSVDATLDTEMIDMMGGSVQLAPTASAAQILQIVQEIARERTSSYRRANGLHHPLPQPCH